ncbi:MAG: hypothetical protein AAF633_01150 [Chloroflexota bacterium]
MDSTAVARLCGISAEEAEDLMEELHLNGVFSRDRRGWIYNRRMVKDAKRSATGKKFANKRWSQTNDKKAKKPPPNGLPTGPPTTQKPEARGQTEEESKASSSDARDARADADPFSIFWEAHPNQWDETATESAFDALIKAGGDPGEIIASARAYAAHVASFSEIGRVQQSNNFLDPERGMWRQFVTNPDPPPPTEDEKLEHWATQIRAGRGYGLQRQMAEHLVSQGRVTKDQLNQAKGYNG